MPHVTKNSPSFKQIVIKPLHIPKGEELYFTSIITEFTDTWQPRWTPTNVYGRMDPVSFYGGTGRELTLGFRVISDYEEEASENMRKLEKLIQYQYPLFKKHGGTSLDLLTAPPYFEVKFMNILQNGQGSRKGYRGYINGPVQITPGFQAKDQAMYFSPNGSQLYFSDVNVVLRFQILHEGSVGNMKGGFKGNAFYPYNVAGNSQAAAAPAARAGATNDGASDSTPAQGQGGNRVNVAGGQKIIVNKKELAAARHKRDEKQMAKREALNRALASHSSGAWSIKGRTTPDEFKTYDGPGIEELADTSDVVGEHMKVKKKMHQLPKEIVEAHTKKKVKNSTSATDAQHSATMKEFCKQAKAAGDLKAMKEYGCI